MDKVEFTARWFYDSFDPSRFTTNWDDLSDNAKEHWAGYAQCYLRELREFDQKAWDNHMKEVYKEEDAKSNPRSR